MKSACLLLYADSMDDFDKGLDFSTLDPQTALKKYVDNPEKYNTNYKFAVDAGGKWFVSYTIPTGTGAAEIKAKLAGKAKSVGLMSTTDVTDTYTGTGDTVMMVAR